MNHTNDLDTSETITHVSLCAGYGGIDLGLKRAIPNLRTVAFSEIEAFACANLVSKMEAGLLDAAPIWTNLKTFPWDSFRGKVDILSGGYPCQPFSSAGKRLGTDDPRHLWPFIADGIARMQPRACFFENVEGHITLGLRNVLHDLAGLGYRATWGVFSAAEVGAPHQRKRVFILAHRSGSGLQRHWGLEQVGLPQGRGVEEGHSSTSSGFRDAWPSRPGQPQFNWEPLRIVANSKSIRNHIGLQAERGTESSGSSDLGDTERPEWRKDNHWVAGEANKGAGDAASSDWRKTEPPLGGDTDGFTGGMDYAKLCVSCDNRTDELRLLGNGVVPATAERAFLILNSRFHEPHKR